MKKLVLTLCFLILVGVLCACSAKVETFSLKDYEAQIAAFSSEMVCGAVHDADAAKNAAEQVWREVFGDAGRRPYRVFRDAEHGAWFVQSAPPGNLFGSVKGGCAYLILEEASGRVLAVWHEE